MSHKHVFAGGSVLVCRDPVIIRLPRKIVTGATSVNGAQLDDRRPGWLSVGGDATPVWSGNPDLRANVLLPAYVNDFIEVVFMGATSADIDANETTLTVTTDGTPSLLGPEGVFPSSLEGITTDVSWVSADDTGGPHDPPGPAPNSVAAAWNPGTLSFAAAHVYVPKQQPIANAAFVLLVNSNDPTAAGLFAQAGLDPAENDLLLVVDDSGGTGPNNELDPAALGPKPDHYLQLVYTGAPRWTLQTNVLTVAISVDAVVRQYRLKPTPGDPTVIRRLT